MVPQEGDGEAEGEERLVDHGHHVVGVPQYPVIDVQRGQLLLVDAHHVLGLGGHQLLLHLEPGHGLCREKRKLFSFLFGEEGGLTETAVRDVEGGVVETLDVPILNYVVEHSEGPGQPEEDADHDEDLSEEPHLSPVDELHHLQQRDLVAVFVVLG